MLRLLAREFWIISGTLIGVSFIAFLPQFLASHAVWQQMPIHYSAFIQDLLLLRWGENTSSGQTVTTEIMQGLTATLELAIVALFLALSGGLMAGLIATRHAQKWPDKLLNILTLVTCSLPTFWTAFILVFVFSLTLSWLPVSGRIGFLFDIESYSGFYLFDSLRAIEQYGLTAFFSTLSHLLLPGIVAALLPMAMIARVTRSALEDAMTSDYIRMARGQGIPENRLLWVYALRNAAVPLLNILASQLSVFTTSLMLTEVIFSWPGLGKWLIDAAARHDYRAVQFGVFTLVVFIIVFNALMDLMQSRLNPLRWKKRR